MGKKIAEHQPRIDLRAVKKDGSLEPGSCGEIGDIWYGISADTAILRYWNGQHGIGQTVGIKRVPCYLGGHRVSFICPICARQVMVLYVGDSDFKCKDCGGLRYLTQTKHHAARLLLKSERIRQKLQASPDDPTCKRVARPLHMRQTTFERLRTEARDCYRQAMSKY